MSALRIASANGVYEVRSWPNLEAALRDGADMQRAALVDARVLERYRSAITTVIPDERILPVPADEEHKSFARLEPIIAWLLECGFRRDHRLLVVGGGILQDIGCFVASILMRGVAWEFVPTTLLAQCDSCIGSKSSINVGVRKNQLGTFHAPTRVHLVAEVLDTLAADDVRSGLGEVIKFRLVEGDDAFAALRRRLPRPATDRTLLVELALESLAIKQRYIEADERDTGIRTLLNYGHTFGHAFEAATDYAIPHGIAVSLGMSAATWFSHRLGLVARGHYDDVDAYLAPFYAPYQRHLRADRLERMWTAMRSDKKNTGDRVAFILTAGPGRMAKRPLSADEARPLLAEWIAQKMAMAGGAP